MRAFLLFLSRREGFKNLALRFGIFRKTAWRFVAGESLDDAVRAVREANRQKLRGTLDLLGENTLVREDALRSTREILGIFDRIEAEKVDCNVSIKLTQLGLDLDPEFCFGNLHAIVKRAREHGNFVRVDMEDRRYTEQTIELVLRAHKEMDNVGAVLQAYLYRTEKDAVRLAGEGIRVRLCKGAYLEPDSIAFGEKKATDANFVRVTKLLLDSGIYHAFATHDPAMIRAACDYVRARGIGKERFEFQMLYGIRRDLQLDLARQGYNVRIYIPYGQRWYPYFMRRLAERPANLAFILRNLLRG